MAHMARLQKLREYEDRLNTMKHAIEDEGRAAHVAQWHTASEQKMKQLTIQRRLEAITLRRESDVAARRQLLAQKLYQEDLAYKQELLSSQETPEQRRAKLAARARELAARREQERQALADSLYQQAFRENCDVLRDTNSKRILYRTLEERTAQIEQAMAQRLAEEEEQRLYTQMNETQRAQAEQRYQQEKTKQKELQQATVRVLNDQVRAIEQRRADEASARQQEIAELRALWQRMEAEQDAADGAERERMRHLAAELQQFNQLRQMQLSERDRRERELDLKVLQEALAREAGDEAREAEQRARRYAEVRKYREQLALMMQKRDSESAGRDALIEQAAAEQQAKRDAELGARDAARRRLMAEVDAIRQQQIAAKHAAQQAAQEAKAAEREAAEAAAAQEAGEAEARRLAKLKAAVKQRLDVQTQMVSRAHIKAAEEDEKLRAQQVAAEAEAAYMGKVQDTLRGTEPSKWYGRKKFDWYT